MDSVYVCRRTNCRHIVAAFTPNMDNKQLAELMKQFTLAGYRLELATDEDVRFDFDTHCDCNRPKPPPLLEYADRKINPETGEIMDEETEQAGAGEWQSGGLFGEEELVEDEGVDQESIDAVAEEPQAEGIDF